jgi:glycosyltransferase involved in cell wall biosynthesis
MTTPRTRILLTAWSGQFAGVERRMLQESQALTQLGYDVAIAHTSFPTEAWLLEGAQKLGVPTIRLDIPPFLRDWRPRHIHYLKFLARTMSFRKMRGFDLVHIFMPWSNAGLEHAALVSRLGLPFVISAHNAFSPVSPTPWHDRFLAPAFARLAGVYGVSRSALEHFEAAFARFLPESAERRVVYNFVDTEQFVPNPDVYFGFRKKLGLPRDSLLVGCVGRIAGHKRPIYTLDIFARVAARFPGAHFVFVGEGDLSDQLRQQIGDMGLRDRVTILPFTDAPEETFPALDLHVLLSKVEGFGISTVEALSSGVPVIATAVPGSTEVVAHEETGYLVSKDDPDEAFRRICQLLDDASLRAALGRSGRADCEARFSRHVWAKTVADFYETVLHKT